MSFFNLSDGSNIETNGAFSSMEDIKPIPSKTQLKVAIEEAKWDEYDGEQYINLTWSVIDGEYKNRKIFHKLKVKNESAKKRDKDLRMLAAIDSNAKGGLVTLGREPSNQDLQTALIHKPMVVMVQVWKIEDQDTGETKQGNWISSVSPLNTPIPESNSSDDEDFFDI